MTHAHYKLYPKCLLMWKSAGDKRQSFYHFLFPKEHPEIHEKHWQFIINPTWHTPSLIQSPSVFVCPTSSLWTWQLNPDMMTNSNNKCTGGRLNAVATDGTVSYPGSAEQNTLVSTHKWFSRDHTQTLNTVIHFFRTKNIWDRKSTNLILNPPICWKTVRLAKKSWGKKKKWLTAYCIGGGGGIVSFCVCFRSVCLSVCMLSLCG